MEMKEMIARINFLARKKRTIVDKEDPVQH